MANWLAILFVCVGVVAAVLLSLSLIRRRRNKGTTPATAAPVGAGTGETGAAPRVHWNSSNTLQLLGIAVSIGIAVLGAKEIDGTERVRIDLAASQFNPQGDDRASKEYVCLVNVKGKPVDIGGWVLRDSIHDVNTLPELTLKPKHFVRVHPGKGANSSTDIFGSSNVAAWNNQGDTVTLLDAKGRKVDSRSYGPRKQNDAFARCGSTAGKHGGKKRKPQNRGAPRELEQVGSRTHTEDAKFCSTHTCIGDFTTQNGTIAECEDGTFSHAGGSSGACSHHGGVRRE